MTFLINVDGGLAAASFNAGAPGARSDAPASPSLSAVFDRSARNTRSAPFYLSKATTAASLVVLLLLGATQALSATVGAVLYGWAIDHFFGWNALECSLLSAYFGGVVGFMLFHGQHSFEDGYVRRGDEWSFQDAAIEGSSHMKIPRCFKWFTMGIEYHHIHHHDPAVADPDRRRNLAREVDVSRGVDHVD